MAEYAHLKTIGLYIPEDIKSELASHLYDEAGVTDIDSYFDGNTRLPRGDPGGEITNKLFSRITDDFADLYETADFEGAEETDPHNFSLIHVAVYPTTSADFKDQVQAAKTIQKTDSRTVHTAILRTALDTFELPDLPEDKVFDDS